MRLTSLRIQNFRAFKDETISFGDYTCLVGPNGTGKSTVLTALKVFFQDSDTAATDLARLQEEDFHMKVTTEPIRITLTFEDLSEEAQEDFAAYYRGGKLIVSAVAVWDSAANCASVIQHGERMAIPDFKVYFAKEKEGASADELKTTYASIRDSFDDLPDVRVKAQMKAALQDYESEHPELCKVAASKDQFYGFTKGAGRLRKYVQWICVPAVKDATTEEMETKATVLGRLLERTVRTKISFDDDLAKIKEDSTQRYQELLRANEGALAQISEALNQRIQHWGHPEAMLRLEWYGDPEKAVNISAPVAHTIAGEGGFSGMLARLGHGLQRSYLLALLQELAGSDDMKAPTLILACEEPELYQHPPQARHLSSVFSQLAEKNSQVILCTHSPYFVPGGRFEDVRLFRKNSATSEAGHSSLSFEKLAAAMAEAKGKTAPTSSGMAAKVEQALRAELSEMFFTPILILVEGPEDAAYITSCMMLTDQWHAFRSLGCHIVPTSGKANMLYPLAIANELGIPTFVVFDADAHEEKPEARAQHQSDNVAILTMCGLPDADPLPEEPFWHSKVVMWNTNIGSIVSADIGADEWIKIKDKVVGSRAYS